MEAHWEPVRYRGCRIAMGRRKRCRSSSGVLRLGATRWGEAPGGRAGAHRSQGGAEDILRCAGVANLRRLQGREFSSHERGLTNATAQPRSFPKDGSASAATGGMLEWG